MFSNRPISVSFKIQIPGDVKLSEPGIYRPRARSKEWFECDGFASVEKKNYVDACRFLKDYEKKSLVKELTITKTSFLGDGVLYTNIETMTSQEALSKIQQVAHSSLNNWF